MRRIVSGLILILSMCSTAMAGEQEALNSLALAMEDEVAAFNLHNAVVAAYAEWVAAHNGMRVPEAEAMIDEGEQNHAWGWDAIRDGQEAFNANPPDYDTAEAYFWEAETLFEYE